MLSTQPNFRLTSGPIHCGNLSISTSKEPSHQIGIIQIDKNMFTRNNVRFSDTRNVISCQNRTLTNTDKYLAVDRT